MSGGDGAGRPPRDERERASGSDDERERGSGSDDERFADAIDHVRPLGRRGARAPQPTTPPRRPSTSDTDSDSTTAFVSPDPGEPLLGYADGIDRRQLERLRRGRIAVERDVDLHGKDREAARESVCKGIERARERGERCVRIVHGRGSHSAERAVLRAALPGWLGQSRLRGAVLAFAPDPESGRGATLVLLRRDRAGPG